ncbi:hypothetical protein KUV61_00005 [Nocardioides marinus]|nr:hypothetical protein [Nocardioides marinus]
MSDFVVFATWESVWSSFASNPQVMGGARDATIGDENSTVDVGANTEFTYTGIPSGSTAYNGPYSLYEFTLSNGGQAVWMAGVGNSGGIVVPLDATAYDTFVTGTTFTVASSTALSQYAYSSFYTPPINQPPTGSVTISGTASEGQTLTASNSISDADGVGTISYQWQRDGVDISGANGSTYTLTQTDVGAAITVTASYTDNAGNPESVTSSATAAVTNVNDAPTGSVNIVGTAAEDQVLTATNSLADEDGLGSVTYQWQRDGVDITAATASTYALSQKDVGATITVVASYTDGGGTTESVTSAGTAPVANVNDDPTGNVTIAGTAAEDQTLTAANTLADEDGLGTIAYQWKRDGVDISGASGSTYTLTQDDVGAVITVAATYTDGEGTTESVTSAATATVTNVNDDPTGSVTIAGTAAEDQTLTAANTLADEDGLGTIAYQWKRDGVDISGASGSTYTLTQDDVGAVITVAASYTDGEGTTESVTSAATATVTNVNDDPTGSVSIVGAATQGQTLTATNTLADEDGLGSISYQWKRNGVDIAGATGDTYTLSEEDVGATITTEASYLDGEGTTEVVLSEGTTAIRYGDLHQVGTSDDDEMRGRYGDDALTGGKGEDSIIGGWGHDTLKGNTGSDSLHGWKGDDLLLGGKDDDALYGGKGNDTLKGGTGNDLLLGRLDNDVIAGGKGRDTLKGGKGEDFLTGGFGADTFVFGRDHGNDTITDFGQGNDLIEIIRGAKSLEQVTFSQDGNDVLLSFGSTTVLVESTTVAELNDADHFLFT